MLSELEVQGIVFSEALNTAEVMNSNSLAPSYASARPASVAAATAADAASSSSSASVPRPFTVAPSLSLSASSAAPMDVSYPTPASDDDEQDDWLEELYEALPEAIQARILKVYEGYLDQRVNQISDLFVLVCGRPGTAKSSLINAILGEKDLLVTSASRQTATLVPTRIRRADDPQDGSWSFRVVFRQADLWRTAQQDALTQLRDTIDAQAREALMHALANGAAAALTGGVADAAAAEPTAAHIAFAINGLLSEAQTINVLRAAYHKLNPAYLNIIQQLVLLVPNILGPVLLTSWTQIEAFNMLHKAVYVEPTLPNHLKDFDCGFEQHLAGLTKEQVRLLLELLCQSPSLPLDVVRFLLVRHLLVDINASLESCVHAWNQMCPPGGPTATKKQNRQGVTALSAAHKLAAQLAQQHQGLRLPAEFFNVWPIVEFVEITGPVNLSPHIVLVDSVGAQDDQHLVDPVRAALDSLPRSPSLVWLTSKVERSATNQSPLMSQLFTLGHLVGWSKLAVVWTRCDKGEKDELGPNGVNLPSCRKSIQDKLHAYHVDEKEVRRRLDLIRIYETSTFFHWASCGGGDSRQSIMELGAAIRARWELEDDDLDDDELDATLEGLRQWAGIRALQKDLVAIHREEANAAERIRRQFAVRLLLHIDFARSSSEDNAKLSASYYDEVVAHISACQCDSIEMREWHTWLEGRKHDEDRIGKCTAEQFATAQASIQDQLLTEATAVFSSLQDVRPPQLPGLLRNNGTLKATTQGKHVFYSVAHIVGTLFADQDVATSRLEPHRQALFGIVQQQLDKFHEGMAAALIPPSTPATSSSSQDLLESRAAHLRKILMNEMAALQTPSALTQLWAPPPDFAHELWQESVYRAEWNKIWGECIQQLEGDTQQKKDALVANLADIAPRPLQDVFHHMLLEHLRQQQNTILHHMRTGLREVSERLLEAMRPLALEPEALCQLNDVQSRLQLRLRPPASPSAAAGAAVGGADGAMDTVAASSSSAPKRKANATHSSDGRDGTKRANVATSGFSIASAAPHAASAAVASAAAAPAAHAPIIHLVASPGTTRGTPDGAPTIYQDPQGQRFCVFFRGLCAAQSTEAFRDNPHVHSALVGPIDEVFRTTAYHTMSAFVTVEDLLRAQGNQTWSNRPVGERVIELAQRLGADISAASANTFDRLTEPLHVNPRECSSRSLAFYPTPREFESFRFASQQVYSNNDIRFMQSYADVAADIAKHAPPRCEPNVAALVNREAAVKAKASNKDRWRYLRLEAWRWMGNPHYVLPRHPLASSLHGNPYLSITDNCSTHSDTRSDSRSTCKENISSYHVICVTGGTKPRKATTMRDGVCCLAKILTLVHRLH